MASRAFKTVGSAAKILVEQPEQEVILPNSVDAEITPGQAFTNETAFFEHAHRCVIRGDAGRLDTVQVQLAEHKRQQYAQRTRHISLTGEGLPGPVADRAGLDDTAPHIRERDPADQSVIVASED